VSEGVRKHKTPKGFAVRMSQTQRRLRSLAVRQARHQVRARRSGDVVTVRYDAIQRAEPVDRVNEDAEERRFVPGAEVRRALDGRKRRARDRAILRGLTANSIWVSLVAHLPKPGWLITLKTGMTVMIQLLQKRQLEQLREVKP